MTLNEIQTLSLKKTSGDVTRNTRNFICVRFRKMCESRADAPRLPAFLLWSHLEVVELPAKPMIDRYCCENECASCEQGYHERCRKGCTLSSRQTSSRTYRE